MNIMKFNPAVRAAGVCLGLITIAGSAGTGFAADRSAAWRFDSASATAPEVNTGFVGAKAKVTVGENGLAWTQSFPGVGDATGLYDLGNQGCIQLDLGGGVTGPALLKVKVRQWFDGWIFGTFVSVQVPGATLAGSSLSQMTPAKVGSWVVSELAWDVPAGVTVAAVSVTGPATGSVVDEVSVVAPAIAPVVPLELSITATDTPGVFELSWPEAAGAATVESATDLSAPENWSALSSEAQVVSGRYTVTANGDGGTRYFRLKR